METPTPSRALPPGYQYRGHCGNKARLRYLRQRLARVVKLRDPASVAALARLRASVADEPDPEYGAMHLAHVSLEAAEDCGATWAESLNHMLDRFDAGEGN